MTTNETMHTYKVTFTGRQSGAIGVFDTIEETYRAASASHALQECLNDERYELNHFDCSPQLLATEEPTQ